jgi:hypothetical protein
MGIIYRQAKMLLDARRRGIPMHHVVMIGRQTLLLHPSELKSLKKDFGIELPDYRWGEFTDRFLKDCLGAEKVDVLDYSAYEGANLLHDLSQPIPGDLVAKFDLVIEAGTLEHVFNFPVAIKNLMQMIKVGGMLNASTVSNNLCGHGFYQFSPELIFRVFTEENGFKMDKLFATESRYPGVELSAERAVYEVIDPAIVRARVGLLTKGPIMLFFEAVRTADRPIFEKPPLQSDYAAAWQDASTQGSTSPSALRGSKISLYARLRKILAGNGTARDLYCRLVGARQRKEFSLQNRRFFKKI